MQNLAKSLFNKLKNKLAQHPGAVGIGEVGLDSTTSYHCTGNHDPVSCKDRKLEEQRQFLKLVFQLAKHEDKVLVIHARDDENSDFKAADKILELLKEYDLCNARIHHHCFVGGEKEYQDWRSDLPNCYFSISSKSLHDIGTGTWSLLQEI